MDGMGPKFLHGAPDARNSADVAKTEV